MAERIKFTPSQAMAVDAPIMNLLVSAAAGSGKTAVLSARIVKLLKETDADISKMLVVTFTKASAGELKLRLAKEIKKEIAFLSEETDGTSSEIQAKLRSQLSKIELAEISTIHSFCYSLIRKNFNALSLSPSLRIADEVECELLMSRTMETAIDELYENDDSFALFAENLIELRDNKLSEILLGFYKKFIQLPDGIESAFKNSEVLKSAAENFEGSIYAEEILKRCERMFLHYRSVYENAIHIIAGDETAVKAYFNSFDADKRFIEGFFSLEKRSFSAVKSYISGYSQQKLGGYRGEKPTDILEALAQRKSFSEDMKELAARFFSYTNEEISRDSLGISEYSDKLRTTLLTFDKLYSAEKLRYGILDYNDLERFTYKLLIKDSQPTELALSVRSKYDAIFIDEYQDTNGVQDAIFSAISNNNRFMVGDIKQSIYGFRGAEPEIFSSYRESFRDYEPSFKGDSAKIFLSENFRSDKSVIDFSNTVFNKLFNNNSGRVPYLERDALICSKDKSLDMSLPVEFYLVDKNAEKDDGEPLCEEDFVAEKIFSLVSSGVSPDKIVILLRSTSAADKFKRALEARSLACVSGKSEDVLFDYPEVMLLICMLNVIDNPTRDIYLAGLLKSPIFGFSLSELISVKNAFNKGSLYSSLTEFCASFEEENREPSETLEKAKAFFEWLAVCRRYSEQKPSDKVVRYLLMTTPISAVAVKNCGSSARLSEFYEFARAFESGTFKGVHGIVRRIKEISENKSANPPTTFSSADLSAVRIMTIHQSKGCEFEWVFLSDTARRFNTKDKTDSLLYEKELGIGLKLREENGFVRYDTLIRQAISSKIEVNSLDEEMRILYVALTRAKNQLIITAAKGGNRQKSCEDFLGEMRYLKHYSDPWTYLSQGSYLEWLALSSDIPITTVKTLDIQATELLSDAALALTEEESVSKETLEERLAFSYPYERLSKLPTKLSVSKLTPDILDSDFSKELIASEAADFERLPLFMQKEEADGEGRVFDSASSAERGTATHLFMQFCDFDNVIEKGIDSEIKRLLEKAFITEKIAGLIYKGKLSRFFKSDLFAQMRSASSLLREERFNVRLKASEFTLDEGFSKELGDSYILVQGVIDCIIIGERGDITLVDYKTDYTPSDRSSAEALLRERYTAQLSYYRKAIELLYGKKVTRTVIYSFSLGDTVEIE